ncbi:MAG: O-antigen ligase family protein [Clostridia bacterium]|nr:O-antigen ligase family protein [Clostridia bacterium]
MIAQLYKKHFSSQPAGVRLVLLVTISIFLPLYATAAAIIASSVYILRRHQRRAALNASPYLHIAHVLWLLLLVVPLIYRNYIGFLCGAATILIFIIALYIKPFASVSLLNRVCDLCCVMSLFEAVTAVVERFLAPLLGPQSVLPLDLLLGREAVLAQFSRVSGVSYNPNFYAFIMEFIVVIAFYRLLTGRHPVFYIAVAAVNTAVIFLTDCRSAWAALFVGLLVLFALFKKKGGLIGLAAAVVAFGAAISLFPALLPRVTDVGRTTAIRMAIWKGAFADFLRHPVFGRGLLAYYQVTGVFITPHAHNIPLDLLECTGIVGFLLIIVYLVLALTEIVRASRSGGDPARAACALCFGCLTVTMVHGITDMPLMGLQTGMLFFLVMALRPGERLWLNKTLPDAKAGILKAVRARLPHSPNGR